MFFSQDTVETRATQSVRVPVRNLRDVDPSVDVDRLQETLGWEFLRTNIDGVDGGMEEAAKQRGFQLVRPDDAWFPGLEGLREDLQSHQWIFGKTPKFKVSREKICLNSTRYCVVEVECAVSLEFEVWKNIWPICQ